VLEEGALPGDEHPHGYALYFFTPRAVKLLVEE
jgi:hypothetical protein